MGEYAGPPDAEEFGVGFAYVALEALEHSTMVVDGVVTESIQFFCNCAF